MKYILCIILAIIFSLVDVNLNEGLFFTISIIFIIPLIFLCVIFKSYMRCGCVIILTLSIIIILTPIMGWMYNFHTKSLLSDITRELSNSDTKSSQEYLILLAKKYSKKDFFQITYQRFVIVQGDGKGGCDYLVFYRTFNLSAGKIEKQCIILKNRVYVFNLRYAHMKKFPPPQIE